MAQIQWPWLKEEMAQNPLHVSDGYSKVETGKLLLDLKGSEKVELEAKNTYGETPLDMAAKNGCDEAAKLLLSRGDFIEPKSNNEMTPLHFAVWHSLLSDDCSTVKALLEYNVDCSAKDDASPVLIGTCKTIIEEKRTTSRELLTEKTWYVLEELSKEEVRV